MASEKKDIKLVYPGALGGSERRSLDMCLARSRAKLPKAEIVSALAKRTALIEAGVFNIEKDLPVPNAGKIDLFAIDKNRTPILIYINETLDADALCRSFSHADWIYENKEIVEHYFKDFRIYDDVRIWQFTEFAVPAAQSLAKRVKKNILSVFSYKCLNLNDQMWVVVEQPAKAAAKPAGSIPLRSLLTHSEIEDFFQNKNINDEEVTSRGEYVHDIGS